MVQSDLGALLHAAALWTTASISHIAISIVAVLIVAHVVPFLLFTHVISVPGPPLAKFSDLWLLRQAINGNRSQVVDEAHKKYGKFVRIAPNHISVLDPCAVNAVYGHSTGTLKSEFYDAFVPPAPAVRGLFNTRDRADHSRKRKIVSHTFAPKSIVAFESFIRKEVQLLLDRWDEFCAKAEDERKEGARGFKGYAWLDALLWLNYWAFDTIGDLAFGKTFGMLEKGKDEADAVIEDANGNVKTIVCSAVGTINLRGEVSATLGVAPVWLRPYLIKLPWFAERMRAVKTLTGIALARVNDRLANGSERDDLLAKLQAATDERGEQMGKMELTAEALTQLIAGSDTTSNTSCAILYHVGSHPEVAKKLQAELDEALADAEDVPLYSQVDKLPYLSAVISESLRFHSTSSIGLPRILPPGGATVSGRYFPGGTILSVPTYSLHRHQAVWGADADEYKPERWLAEGARKQLEAAFIPFSRGPRGCIGSNLALMELQIVLAAIFRRYDVQLESLGAALPKMEGFLVKPTKLCVGLRRRA